MIVSPKEYSDLLYRLNDPNLFANMIQIPDDERIYEINLNTREIEAPEFLSVSSEHNAEIIWFKMDRFFDNIDLYNATCWIQFINANGEELFCAAPITVALEKFGNEKVLIPWPVNSAVTKKSGTIKFSFQFFKLSEDHLRFLYLINTKPATSKVLPGLLFNANLFDDKEIAEAQATPAETECVATLLHELTEKYEVLSKNYVQHWLEVK